MTSPSTDWLDLEDLEPPVKMRRLLIETTSVHEVWVEDYEDVGAEALAKSEAEGGEAYELISPNEPAVDGWLHVRAPGEWDREQNAREHGPWPLCPMAGCTTPASPVYGYDPACYRHQVRGAYMDVRLPEKTEW